jgi:DNA-nicking Smr family endonuclease
MDEEEVVEIPIEGDLDLHSFHPRDIPGVVASYLDACREKGLCSVRLVHGRGQGVQRAVVRCLLSARSDVVSFRDARPDEGGWGATRIRLRPTGVKTEVPTARDDGSGQGGA